MSNLIELKVPDIGGHSNVDVIEVFIQPGQTVAVDDSLITLETDKATMEVPAETAGVVKEVRAVLGGKISEGDVIAIIEVGASAAAPAPAAAVAAVKDILEIVNIINYSFKKLLFFKFVVQIERFDPFRIQAVHYDFSVSNQIPASSFFLVEEQNSISPSECI